MKRYVIGIDYGTLSGRCVLVDAECGVEVAQSVLPYAHAVMDKALPCGAPLPPDYALQHPQDYLDVLRVTVSDVLHKSGVRPEEVLGIGIDFTASTLLPINEDGEPLCFLPNFEQNMHAYAKLWKHHAAQYAADEINALAKERGEEWLARYGGKTSCEWAFPKILQILREAPEVYDAAHSFIEAADWISLCLTGKHTRSAAFAGYKWLWDAENGYPSNEFFRALDERFDGIIGTKVCTNVLAAGGVAGLIDSRGASLTGLCEGTVVAVPMIDAHAAMPALNVTEGGDLMLVLGTSACHILNSDKQVRVDGICGYVKDGVIPGLLTYEAGQSGVGDIFDWFVKTCVPANYLEEAASLGVSIHKILRDKAMKLTPGQSGLLALDWHSGNRSVLVNSNLSGLVMGLTLATTPEEIYRALIEATAFGLKVIIDRFESSGIEIKSICAAGGIALKDEMLMQIYSDVLAKEINVSSSTQAAALGSAVYALVAAGIFESVEAAARHIAKPYVKTYLPIEKNVRIYGELYAEYKLLHDYFGTASGIMERLKAIRDAK